MLRAVEVIGMVFIFLIIASCICISDINSQNSSTWGKNEVYAGCANALHAHGFNSNDYKVLVQECVANSINKQGKQNDAVHKTVS